jgi:hypothetical protein
MKMKTKRIKRTKSYVRCSISIKGKEIKAKKVIAKNKIKKIEQIIKADRSHQRQR